MSSPRLLLASVVCSLILEAVVAMAEESLEARRTSLAQLPLEKLLHVKQALLPKGLHEKGDTTELVEVEEDFPLPLRSQEWDKRKRRKPVRRGDWWEEEKDSKGKDISSIFQSTVTILSFLAFGGYLLCMIVQAVRTGQGGAGSVTTTTSAPAALMGRKRRKRAAEETMLRTLHRIAEAYVAHSLLKPQPSSP